MTLRDGPDPLLPSGPPRPLPQSDGQGRRHHPRSQDAVAPQDRRIARQSLIENPMDPDRTIIRINPADTEDFRADLRALEQTRYRHVMLAKTEDPESLTQLAGYSVIGL